MSEPTAPYGTPEEPAERKAARARLEAQRAFTSHVFAFVLINLLLIGIWAVAGFGYFWPGWSLLGWGIGLAFHAFGAYGPQPRPISDADIDAEVRRRRGDA